MQKIKELAIRLLKFMNKTRDKQLHFFYISFFTRIYTLLWSDPTQCLVITSSFLIMMGISIFKQYIDKQAIGGEFDYKDILAGMLGWLFSILLTIIRMSQYDKGIDLFPCM